MRPGVTARRLFVSCVCVYTSCACAYAYVYTYASRDTWALPRARPILHLDKACRIVYVFVNTHKHTHTHTHTHTQHICLYVNLCVCV